MNKEGASFKVFVVGVVLVIIYATVMLGIIWSTW